MAQAPAQLHDLLQAIRDLYVDELARAVHSRGEWHVEPALRKKDGALARAGTPPTPQRLDLLNTDPSEAFVVESTQRLSFPPTTFELDGLEFQAASFFWDAANFSATAAANLDLESIVNWFEHWFDPNDQHAVDEVGLYGVVHRLNDLTAADGTLTFQVDFGSAPIEAFTELLHSLARAGATAVRVS